MSDKKKHRKAIEQRKRERIAEFGEDVASMTEEQPRSENQDQLPVEPIHILLGVATLVTLGLIIVAIAFRSGYFVRINPEHQAKWEAEIRSNFADPSIYEPVAWYDITERSVPRRSRFWDVFIHVYRSNDIVGEFRSKPQYKLVKTSEDFVADSRSISEKEAKERLKLKGIKLPATQQRSNE